MLIKFANVDVEAWKVRQGVVVSLSGNLYHVKGFILNDKLLLDDSMFDKKLTADCERITWLEPH